MKQNLLKTFYCKIRPRSVQHMTSTASVHWSTNCIKG